MIGASWSVEDGPASFQIFLTVIFFAFTWTQGAATSETHFCLKAGFAEPGWICIMAFDGGGAFLLKRVMGATGENLKVEPSSFLGSRPSSCCTKKEWN
jgi:hypothetical protein